MAECPAISRPPLTYNSTILKSSVLGDHNSNHLVSFHSLHWLLCYLKKSPKSRSINQKSFVSQKTWTLNMQNFFPCITNEQSLPDNFPSKTITSTPRTLSPKSPEQYTCRAESSPLSAINSLFNIIFWVTLSYQLKALSPRRPEQWMCRIFPSVINKLPFQGHLSSNTIISIQSSVFKETRTSKTIKFALPKTKPYRQAKKSIAIIKTSRKLP